MFYKNYTEEELDGVISCLLGGEKFKAVARYKELSKLGAEQTILDVIGINRKVKDEFKNGTDFAMKHLPEKCCINCVGLGCCSRKENIEHIFDSRSGAFCGSTCTSFLSCSSFINERVGYKFTFGRVPVNENIVKYFEVKVEENIVAISIIKWNNRQNRMVSSKKKVLTGDTKRILSHIIKTIREKSGNVMAAKSPEQYTLGNMKVEPNETYSQYVERYRSYVREENKKIEEESYNVSYGDACNSLISMLGESEREMVASFGGDLKAFIRAFYPNKSVWEVVEIKKRQNI